MKHAMILGATGGIGQALVDVLSADYQLTMVGRNIEKLKDLKSRYGGSIIPSDICSELEVQALFQEAAKVDLLIYTAGAVDPKLIKMTSADSWDNIMATNLTGVFYTLKHAEAKLDGTQVIVIGARPELVTYRGFSAYAASKAALERLLEIAAIEMKRKATFTLVLPKAVNSNFWDNVGKVPANALEPQEVAQGITKQLSEELAAGELHKLHIG